MRNLMAVAALIVVVFGGVSLLASGECQEVGTWWMVLDVVTFQDVGTWATWWYGGPVCWDGTAIY